MSLKNLTQDLENFKWTDYDNVGDNLSQTGGRHGGTLPGGQPPHQPEHSQFDDGAGTPQSFYDGHSSVVTGQKTFERPNRGALADMESRFGPLSTQPLEKGPYGVADYMDGTMQGRGFIPPGGPPLGFTVDMGVSEYAIGDPLNYTLTPLSHTIAAVNSGGPHGSVPEHTIDIQFGTSWSNPEAINAWAEDFMTTPLANYVSQYTEPVDSLTHQVDMITLTGPTVPDEDHYLNVTPKVDNAHGSDFMTLPISGYPGLYIGSQGDIVPIIPSVLGLGVSDSISATWPDKIFHQLGNLQDEKLYDVYQHHFLPTIENFNHISLLTDLFEDESISVAAEKWKDGSVHIGTQDWAAPVGGGVTSWANLMPVTPRYSMFRDAQGNYQVPTLFPHEWVNQPTFNVLGGYPESTYGGGYTINSQFGFSWNDLAGWFMETIDDSGQGDATNYSSAHGAYSFEIGPESTDLYESMPKYHLDTPLTIKWHLIDKESEEWPYKQFGFSNSPEDSFNEGSLGITTSTGALVYATQPFIRRQAGQGYLDGRGTGVVGADHLATVIARIEEDTTRINAWLNTPAGKNWHNNQYTLQNLNPRPETRTYNPGSLLISLVPHLHGQRHLSGFFGIFGPGKYGDLGTDKDYHEDDDDAPIWGYGRIGSGAENTFKHSRLTRLTKLRINLDPEGPSALSIAYDEASTAGVEGEGSLTWDLIRETALVIEDWSSTNLGRTPKTPSHDVKSQLGAYGETRIYTTLAGRQRGFPKSQWWLQASHSPTRTEPKKSFFVSSYAGLFWAQSYGNLGNEYSNLVNRKWAYLDPNSYDKLSVEQRTYGVGLKDNKFELSSKNLFYGVDKERPDDGTISWTIAGDGTAYSINNFLGTLDENDRAGIHMTRYSKYHSAGLTSKIGLYANHIGPPHTGKGGTPKGAPTTSPDYFTLGYQYLGHDDLRNAYGVKPSDTLHWRSYKSKAASIGGDDIWFPASGILNYSWKFWDPANKKLVDYIGPAGITQLQKFVDSDGISGLENNIFTIGKGSHGNLNPRQALFWEESVSQDTEMTETPYPILSGILPGSTKITPVTVISLLKNGKWSIGHGTAPRSSEDINFLVLPYQGLDIETSYGKDLGSNPWPIDDTKSFSSLIRHSWRFFDKSHKDKKDPYWDDFKAVEMEFPAEHMEAEFEDTVGNLIDSGKVFTINKRASQGLDFTGQPSGNLLKRYSTLTYGNLNKNVGYTSNKGINLKAWPGVPISPSEFNSSDTHGGSGNSLADMKNFNDRRESQKTIKAIGEAGTPDIGPLIDTVLGVIKKGTGGDKHTSVTADKVNLIPYGLDYTAKDFSDAAKKTSDFIKFKFYDVINNKFIIFRALLSGISDSISPEWTGTRYIGRPDQVYVYQGAERKINFSFDIYPKTKQELPVLWEKLNHLVGLCYPSYKESRMVAPFMNLTIGDMFVGTPGFLDSLSVEVNDMSTWEIQEGFQFPKHITCQCSFTYIGKHLHTGGPLGKHYGFMEKITESPQIDINNTVEPVEDIVPLTFGEVFNAERADGEKTFTYNGILYNTMTAEEKAGGKVFWNGTSWGEPASQGADESTDWGPAQGMGG